MLIMSASSHRDRHRSRSRSDKPTKKNIVGWRSLFILVAIGLTFFLGARLWKRNRVASLRQSTLRQKSLENWYAMEQNAVLWAKASPNTADPFVYAAEAALARSSMAQAAEYLKNIPDDHPAAVSLLLERVDMLFADLAEPLEAEKTCYRILSIDPTCGPARKRLTFFYAMTLQRSRMARQAREAIQRECELPESYVYLVGSEWMTLSNIARVNRPWLEKHPDEELFLVATARGNISNRGDDFYEQDASAHETDGEQSADQYASRLSTLFDRFPKNLELLAYFIETAVVHGDIERVTTLLATVPPTGQKDNRFWRYKGWLHAQRNELEKARASLEHAISLNTFDFMSRHYLADVLRKCGELELARTEARIADEGRSLRRTILTQPEVQSMPLSVMKQVESFVTACGDTEIATHLHNRVIQTSNAQMQVSP